MNKTAILAAASHADKNTEHKNAKALEAAGKLIAKSDDNNKLAKAAMKNTVKTVVHTGERVLTMGAASTAKGFFGTADVAGVDTRAVGGTLITLVSLFGKVKNNKSTLADHGLAVGEGLLMSYGADKFTELGQSMRTKWDARGENSVSGDTTREVKLTPPAISGGGIADEEELPARFVYADVV